MGRKWFVGLCVAISAGWWGAYVWAVRNDHCRTYGHPAPFGLHADVKVYENAHIGIPGVTKLYEAELTNLGILPITLRVCDFIDDTMSPGTMVAYDVERLDRGAGQWERIVDASTDSFCRPYPLGILEARWKHEWLWPGAAVGTGEEATAARHGVALDDSLRFVVYVSGEVTESQKIPTQEFVIDEVPAIDASDLRLRH